MIKISGNCNTYTDSNSIFTVEVEIDNTNDIRTITSLKGPGVVGDISAINTDAFLSLMRDIANDLSIT